MEIDIKRFIELNIQELDGKVFPIFTTELDTLCATYKITPISGGHIKQSQLEVKIIWHDFDRCKETEEKIKELFDMEEDESFKNVGATRFRSSLSGGGCLFNDGCQMWEDTLYFILDWRKING